MKSWIVLLAALGAAAPALAAPLPPAPTAAELSQALAQVQGAPPRVASVRCRPSGPGYVRCTYLQLKGLGYSRMAVLVTPQRGRWTVSEGPVRERAPGPVRR